MTKKFNLFKKEYAKGVPENYHVILCGSFLVRSIQFFIFYFINGLYDCSNLENLFRFFGK